MYYSAIPQYTTKWCYCFISSAFSLLHHIDWFISSTLLFTPPLINFLFCRGCFAVVELILYTLQVNSQKSCDTFDSTNIKLCSNMLSCLWINIVSSGSFRWKNHLKWSHMYYWYCRITIFSFTVYLCVASMYICMFVCNECESKSVTQEWTTLVWGVRFDTLEGKSWVVIGLIIFISHLNLIFLLDTTTNRITFCFPFVLSLKYNNILRK